MSTVAVIGCRGYSQSETLDAVQRGIDLLGGIQSFVRNGESILLNPNLLAGDVPEKLVTTHPAVFGAVAAIFRNGGGKLLYGDSPGIGKPARAAQRSGIKGVADRAGITAADFSTPVEISFPEGTVAKKLILARGAVDADGIISISKMKTHGLTRITGAVKNQFGLVPGLLKGEYHVKMPDIRHFSTVLVDITRYIKPRLYIMDGIMAMEGNGPRSGSPKEMGVLLFSTDPVALDSVFCRLINLDPRFVPTMKPGKESGLGVYDPTQIQLVGDPMEPLIQNDFDIKRHPPDDMETVRHFPTFLKPYISPKPVIDYDTCTNCGSCVKQCPVVPRAVDWQKDSKNPKPEYDYKLCIRCYCCQEICPHRAITIHTPLLGRLFRR